MENPLRERVRYCLRRISEIKDSRTDERSVRGFTSREHHLGKKQAPHRREIEGMLEALDYLVDIGNSEEPNSSLLKDALEARRKITELYRDVTGHNWDTYKTNPQRYQ